MAEANQPFDLTVKMPKAAVLDVHEKQLYVKHQIFSLKKCNMKISVGSSRMTSAFVEADFSSH